MKRLLAAAVLLTTAITFAVYGYFTICRKIDKITALMENDREITVSQADSSIERVNAITDEWDKHEKFLVSILPHEEIEEIEIGIKCLKNYHEQRLVEEYIKTLNECINQLKHIKLTEKPDMQNIF